MKLSVTFTIICLLGPSFVLSDFGGSLEFTLPSEKRDVPKSLDFYKNNYRLIDALDNGAYPIVHVEEDNTTTVVCDDELTDVDAATMCVMYKYHAGYRTSYVTKQDFHPNILHCFRNVFDYFLSVASGNVYGMVLSKCLVNVTNSLPCAKNQAAAVHCYDIDRLETIQPHIYFVSTHERTWNVHLALDYFKYGQKYPMFGRNGVNARPKKGNFASYHCNKLTIPKLKISTSDKLFQLEGKFALGCDECALLYFDNQYFYSVCKREASAVSN